MFVEVCCCVLCAVCCVACWCVLCVASLLPVVCGALFAARCSLIVVRCVLCELVFVRCLLLVACWSLFVFLLFVGY